MGRSPEVTRRPEAQQIRRSSNGIEEISNVAVDARYVFQRSTFRELHCIALPSASKPLVARCDDIDGGFQRQGFREFLPQACDA